MQIEAESQDLIDRSSISLYGGNYNQKVERDKIEVTKTSDEMKTFGARHRSFASPPEKTLLDGVMPSLPSIRSPRGSVVEANHLMDGAMSDRKKKTNSDLIQE